MMIKMLCETQTQFFVSFVIAILGPEITLPLVLNLKLNVRRVRARFIIIKSATPIQFNSINTDKTVFPKQ